MTIYVDPLVNHEKRGLWCHMSTDGSLGELHDFAQGIGLKREWFQDKPGKPHYDLRPSKRELAIKRGAVPVSQADFFELCFGVYLMVGWLYTAVDFAAGYRSSDSSRWPVQYEDWAVEETVVLVIDLDGRPAAYHREWKPERHYYQKDQKLVASIYHVDGLITVVLADGYEWLARE